MEFYKIEWKGKQLEQELTEKPCVNCNDDGVPTPPWQVHSCLGDDSKIWCEVYRSPKKKGGVFVMRDFDDVLFVAYASTNMAFVQALNVYSEIVSQARYAADIFEAGDDEVFDD